MRTALLAAAALSCAAASAATAAPVAQAPRLHGDLAGFGGDPDELPRAIAALERGGGRVTEIRFDSRAGHPAYDAVVERDGAVRFLRLAQPGSKLVVLRRSEEPDWMLGRRARRDLALAGKAEVGLAAAVREAEADNGGEPAAAAGIATLASDPLRYAPAYNVLLVRQDGRLQRVAVDARTGLAISDVSRLAGWPDAGR